VAKTIGKDKGSLTRARRVSDAETEPVGDPSNDEPRDEDMVAADDATDLEADAAEAEERDAGSRDVALRARDSVARRPAPTIVRGGGRHAPAWMHNNGATRFIAESIDELFKVTWPTPQDAWNMTLVVVVTSAFVAVILGAADAGLIRALEWVVSLSQPATPTH
jgi:preprotein translocase SecE subunit